LDIKSYFFSLAGFSDLVSTFGVSFFSPTALTSSVCDAFGFAFGSSDFTETSTPIFFLIF
jgi:hypothetical protein